MLGILESLIATVTALVQFVINTIEGLFTIIKYIPTYVTFLTSSIGFLPAVIIPFCTIYISLYVVKFILGREN